MEVALPTNHMHITIPKKQHLHIVIVVSQAVVLVKPALANIMKQVGEAGVLPIKVVGLVGPQVLYPVTHTVKNEPVI